MGFIFAPALGSSTVVPSSATDRPALFTAFRSNGDARTPELWTKIGADDWRAIPYERSSLGPDVLVARVPLASARVGERYEWTLRLSGSDGHIDWLGGEGDNGALVVVESASEATTSSAKLLRFALEGGSAVGSTQTFALEAIRDALNAPGATALAVERTKPTWFESRLVTAPATGLSTVFETVLLLVRSPDGASVTAVMPLATDDCCATLRRGAEGEVLVVAERDRAESKAEALVLVGSAPEYRVHQLMELLVKKGREAVRKVNGLTDDTFEPSRSQPFHGLGWATYNALWTKYKLSQVLDMLSKLGAGSSSSPFAAALDTVLLDDGWQDIRDDHHGRRRLYSFGAIAGWMDVEDEASDTSLTESVTSETAPSLRREDSGYGSGIGSPDPSSGRKADKPLADLKAAVATLKHRFPGVRRVGVWITLQGFWDALAPSPAWHKYGPLVKLGVREFPTGSDSPSHPTAKDGDEGASWLLPAIDRVADFWLDWFTALREAGVDFVKCDNQAYVDWAENAADPALAARYKTELSRAMRAASRSVWGEDDGLITCMAHSPRLWNGAFGLGAGPDGGQPCRQSDDYFPDVADSHRLHVSLNLTASVFTRSLSFVPDYDMLQSRHSHAAYHSALRVLGAAPVYLTDTPATHDAALVRSLVGQRPDGTTAVVQSRSVTAHATRLASSLFDDDASVARTGTRPALKAALTVGDTGRAVIGVWNALADEERTQDTLTRRDVADALATGPTPSAADFVLYSRRTGRPTILREFDAATERRQSALTSEPVVALDLPARAFDVFSLVQLASLPLAGSGAGGRSIQVGCVGLVDKLNMLSPIERERIVAETAAAIGPSASLPFLSVVTEGATAEDETASASAFGPLPSSRIVTVLGRLRALITGAGPSSDDFSTTVRSLRTDLRRSPLATLLGEVTSLIRFSTAVFILCFAHILGQQHQQRRRVADERRPLIGDGAAATRYDRKADAGEAKAEEEGAASVLEIRSAFRGRLGVVVVGDAAPSSLAAFKVAIDGRQVDDAALGLETRIGGDGAGEAVQLLTLDMDAALGTTTWGAATFVITVKVRA